MNNQTTLTIKSALDTWYLQISRVDSFFGSLTDEQLMQEVAPGRNRAIYLLGHLTSVHDKMLPLLNFEKQLFPQLEPVFLDSPDRAVDQLPSVKDLRLFWKEVNERLAHHFNRLQLHEWFEKHNSISEEDFRKEPYRNRFNVLLNRTNHLSTHYGQLLLLKVSQLAKK
ncbi:MAG TPA: DinB family protein [Puia sp.]|nr:DinB family protein [Puia sp.]